MADQVRAIVITVSDRCANGVREDRSGPEAARRLTEAGYAVDPVQVIPDGADNVADAITAAVSSGAQLVLTSGGTDRKSVVEGKRVGRGGRARGQNRRGGR